ncbi:hypothetical protein EAI64_13075 [Escherichia coli]|nr:hypothetical protein EAI64_13075 [Escherichia coli]
MNQAIFFRFCPLSAVTILYSVIIFQCSLRTRSMEGANKRGNSSRLTQSFHFFMFEPIFSPVMEGANKRGNSSRLTQSFHFFMFEPIFSPVNALNQPI